MSEKGYSSLAVMCSTCCCRTPILVSPLLNNTCVTMRDTGATTRLMMDAKNSLGLSSKLSEGDNLEHTEARDLF